MNRFRDRLVLNKPFTPPELAEAVTRLLLSRPDHDDIALNRLCEERSEAIQSAPRKA